jgi:hypothetical protein
MNFKEFFGTLCPPMAALGYEKVNETNWILRKQEIMIVSGVVFYLTMPRFDIELGVIFNRVNYPRPWKKNRIEHAHLRTKLYTLLQTMGESTEYLDKLFHWPENDEAVLKNNFSIICELYKKKVIPYLEQFNDYSYLIENFLTKIAWKPFEVKIYSRAHYIDFFNQIVKKPDITFAEITKPSTEQDIFNTPSAKANARKHKKMAAQSAATVKPSEDTYAVVNGLELFTDETIALLTESGQEWHDIWPVGEPMYSRNDGYQFVIHSNQVQQILQISIRKAQDMLSDTRKFFGKDEDGFVSVKEFCKMYKFDEEDFRKALRDIPANFGIK